MPVNQLQVAPIFAPFTIPQATFLQRVDFPPATRSNEATGMANPSGAKRDWRREPRRGPLRLRRLQIGVAWLSLLVLTALLVWASTWLSPPRPARLVLLGAGYQDNLAVPHNVYGWQSLADLAQLTQSAGVFSFWGTHLLSLPHGPLEVWSGTPWDKGLEDVSERTVALFFTLHGAADDQGAFLLTADADGAGQAKHRLRLVQVLERLAKLPPHKHKVLLLDATQMTANWRLGLLTNDFAGQLKRLEPQIAAVPNLVVLCASDAGQRSWVCDEWRRTIFAHYVIEGLKGAAADLENDGRIDAWELHRYVQASVRGWVQANRAAVQTPLLLPSGEEGRRRASHIDLAVVRRNYQPPSPHGVPAFEIPDDLARAWDRHHRLADHTPPPSAYSPQTWRLYQDTLLRYEQLLQAGDRDWAARLQGQLNELATRIEHARTLELSSLSNTLAMPAAAGYRCTVAEDAIQRTASDLWNAAPQEAPEKWLEAQARLASDDLERQLLRLRLCDWLLERAAEDPDTHLEAVVRLLQTINDPLRPRPAEAHYAVMLQRDKPAGNGSSEYTELLRLALSTRRLAEQAALAIHAEGHPYSEFLWDTLAPPMQEADADRRVGEDLLLASPQEWPQARRSLEAARAAYLAALDTGRQIQSALQARDYVLSMLPYYSQCVACRLTNQPLHSATEDEFLGGLLRLWRDTHDLCERLDNLQPDQPDGAAAAAAPRSGNLADHAALVRRSYDETRQRLCRWWQELSSAEVPSVWHEADAALLVPHRDWQLRMKLLANKRRTSRRLFAETAQQSWVKATGRAASNGDTLQAASPSARIQGRLALAVLGRRWFDACGGPGLETFDQVSHRLDVFQVEQDGQHSLAKAGEQIALRWRQLPLTIEKLVADSGSAPRANALALLEQADRLTRQIDGLDVHSLAADPVAACRRLRMQGLLVWQAGRTLADHWYGEDPQGTPYYQVAGASWLNDAQQLDTHADAVTAIRQRYADSRPLTLAGSPRMQLTTQLRQEVIYRIEAGQADPSGFPVLWVEASAGLDLESPDPGRRLVREVAADRPAGLITCTLRSPQLAEAELRLPPTAGVERTALTVHGLFRGQRLTATTPIELHLAPQTTFAMLPLPDRGSLAVRADAALHQKFGQANGTVAIVLDCSGSMGPARGETFGRTTKFAEATAALKQVLARLPRGTTVSVWVFGQAVGPQKTVEPPEPTIRRVQDPLRWDPDNAAQLTQLMARLEYPALEPWNESPIVRAMLAAKQDLAAATGYRTLLVLTDGMDNRFEKTAAGSKADIGATLRAAFQGTGVVVNIVGFKLVDREAAHASRQFSVVETLDPPGKFMTVDQADALAAALDAALRQRLHYRLQRYDNTPLADMPTSGLDVGRSGTSDSWFPGGLPPASYRLRLSAGQPTSAEVAINRGDALLLRLREAGGRLQLSRLDWSKTDFPWKPHTESASWRMSLMQNRRTPEGNLQMLVALERLASDSETVLTQSRPREAWLEVQPRGAAAETVTRWRCVPGYPAAVWNVDVPAWPQAADGVLPARPRVQLWFNADQETPAGCTLRRGHDFTALADLRDRPLRVSGDEVLVERVAVERQVVEARPGVREPQSCLVVRLSHAPDKPVWARVGGMHAAGQEHRYYSSIGASTSFFWPVTADEAELALTSISLVSLEEFKRDAQRRGCLLKLDDVPAPAPDDFAPRAPLELR
jgi:hypothetical protein